MPKLLFQALLSRVFRGSWGLWFPGGPSGFLFSDTCRSPHGSTALLRLPPWAGLGWTPAPHLPGTTPCDCAATMTTGQNDCAHSHKAPPEKESVLGVVPGRRWSEGPAYKGGVTRPRVRWSQAPRGARFPSAGSSGTKFASFFLLTLRLERRP